MHSDQIAIVVPDREQLPPSLLSNIETGFKAAFEQAEKWRIQSLAINVTSIDQKAEMKLARTIRLELKNVRVAAEKKRVELKADALRMGKAIDGVNNLLLAAIVPLERHLEEQEQYGERLIEAERRRLAEERLSFLSPYLTEGQRVPPLETLDQDQWLQFLSDAKLLHAAKIEAARKAEAERIAREHAEAAERERLRVENERLVQEAAEWEAKAKAEREAAEKELALIKAENEAAARKAENEAARERHEARKAAEQAAAYAAEQKRLAESKLLTERLEREKLEKELAAKKAAEEAKAKAEATAKKKAAAAPDKAKLKAIAASVRNLEVPTVTTPEGKSVLAEIKAKIEGFAKWIETQAEKL